MSNSEQQTPQPVQMTPRQVYVQNRQRRQNKVFAIAVMGMGVALAFALIVLSGLVPFPIGNEFSQKVHYAVAGNIPCPSEGAMPSEPSKVHVQILNGTSRQGIAGSASKILENLGFQVTPPENAAKEYPGAVEISAGPAAVDDAWTLARIFPRARVTLTDATDRRVLITLGSFYDVPIEMEEAERAASNPDSLNGVDKCRPLDPDVRQEILDALPAEETAQSAQSQ